MPLLFLVIGLVEARIAVDAIPRLAQRSPHPSVLSIISLRYRLHFNRSLLGPLSRRSDDANFASHFINNDYCVYYRASARGEVNRETYWRFLHDDEADENSRYTWKYIARNVRLLSLLGN